MAEETGKTSFWVKRLDFRGNRSRRARNVGPITALDIDGQTLRVAQTLQRGGRSELSRVAATPLELANEAERSDANAVGAAIAKALRQLQMKPASVVMGIARAQVVLRTLSLPALEDLRELASMVHLQVGRDLPFRMEEAVIDFKVRRRIAAPPPRVEGVLNGGDSGNDASPSVPKVEVLVAAVKREVVDFYTQVAEAAGLKLVALGLLPYANARCVEACQIAEGGQAFALVSLRPDEVSIDVIAEQSLLFSRGANVKPTAPADASSVPSAETANGGSRSTSAAEASTASSTASPGFSAAPPIDSFSEAVTIEVIRTLHSYSGLEPENPASKIVVTGATGLEAGVVEVLGRRLGRPCALLEPAVALNLSADSRDLANGATAAIGLALGSGDTVGLPFDFLNPKRPAVQRDLRRIRILAGIAAAVACMVFLLAIRTYWINKREQVYRSVAAELAEAEKNRPLYRRMIQQSGVIDEWAKVGPSWLEHYAYLSAVLPPSEEVYITSFTVSGPGIIRLSVQARSGETLAKLDKQLRAAGYDVKPLAITPGADRYGYEFRSNVELVVPEKLKIDLAKVKPPARPSDDGSLDPAVRKGGGS